jgi:hypothetical protein
MLKLSWAGSLTEVVGRLNMKPYKVDFWDTFDLSWSGNGPVFDDLSEAIARCNQMQAQLPQSNKDYCPAQQRASPSGGPVAPPGDSGVTEGSHR